MTWSHEARTAAPTPTAFIRKRARKEVGSNNMSDDPSNQIARVLEFLGQTELLAPRIDEGEIAKIAAARNPTRQGTTRWTPDFSSSRLPMAPDAFTDPELDALFADVDGRLHRVEMRGEKTFGDVFFDAYDVAIAFEFDIAEIVSRPDLHFEQGRHFLYFRTEKSPRQPFLTAAGLQKACSDRLGAAKRRGSAYLFRLEDDNGVVFYKYGGCINVVEHLRVQARHFAKYGFRIKIVVMEQIDGDKIADTKYRIELCLTSYSWYRVDTPMSNELYQPNEAAVVMLVQFMHEQRVNWRTNDGGEPVTTYDEAAVVGLLHRLLPREELANWKKASPIIYLEDLMRRSTPAAPIPTPAVPSSVPAAPTPIPAISSGRPRSAVWRYFVEVGLTRASCKFCPWLGSRIASRMRKHILLDCPGVSDDTRQQLQIAPLSTTSHPAGDDSEDDAEAPEPKHQRLD